MTEPNSASPYLTEAISWYEKEQASSAGPVACTRPKRTHSGVRKSKMLASGIVRTIWHDEVWVWTDQRWLAAGELEPESHEEQKGMVTSFDMFGDYLQKRTRLDWLSVDRFRSGILCHAPMQLAISPETKARTVFCTSV